MKILHYSLGFQRHGGGGLTKYCMDLMAEQKRQGDDVSMLWPGEIKKTTETKIVKRRNNGGFGSFEMINPMPVPLLNGIKDIQAFTRPTDKRVYSLFLKQNKFDVIHLHTLMGLPKEFLQVAKELGVKCIYTSHDCFGLCPRVNLLYGDSYCEYDENCSRCEECNKNALPLKTIKIKQSRIYRTLKQSRILNKLKKYNYKPVQLIENNKITSEKINTRNELYVELRKYYMSMFELITKIHFNSSVTEKTYRDHKVTTLGKTINISHKNISDMRKKRQYSDKIRFGYLGPASYRKGFFLFKEVLDSLQEEYKDRFELHLYSKNKFDCDYIIEHKPYDYSQMPQVMDNIDILVLPSICRETFGFTVLESLSYGVPIMISKNVGAQDIVENCKSGFIFEPNAKDMKIKIRQVLDGGTKLLQNMNDYIYNNQSIKTMDIHANEMREFYKC